MAQGFIEIKHEFNNAKQALRYLLLSNKDKGDDAGCNMMNWDFTWMGVFAIAQTYTDDSHGDMIYLLPYYKTFESEYCDHDDVDFDDIPAFLQWGIVREVAKEFGVNMSTIYHSEE